MDNSNRRQRVDGTHCQGILANLYHWSGDSWVEQIKLIASDGGAQDLFGKAVSISGDRLIVGAPYNDDHGKSSGSVYTYLWNGSTWVEQAKLNARDAATHDKFGSSVSISAERVIVGAYGQGNDLYHSEAAYMYYWNSKG